MSYIQVTERRVNLKHTHTQSFGGFFIYIKLVFQLWKQSFSFIKLLPFYKVLLTYLLLALKTPYWIFIKPFASLISLKTTYSGDYYMRNERIVENNIVKVVTIRFIFIPFFCYPSKMNNKDWERIVK